MYRKPPAFEIGRRRRATSPMTDAGKKRAGRRRGRTFSKFSVEWSPLARIKWARLLAIKDEESLFQSPLFFDIFLNSLASNSPNKHGPALRLNGDRQLSSQTRLLLHADSDSRFWNFISGERELLLSQEVREYSRRILMTKCRPGERNLETHLDRRCQPPLVCSGITGRYRGAWNLCGEERDR